MSSLDSANGPSMTVRWALENFTRLALDVGVSPFPSSITPAFTSEFHHLRDEILAGHDTSLGILVSGYQHHDSHWSISFRLNVTPALDCRCALSGYAL